MLCRYWFFVQEWGAEKANLEHRLRERLSVRDHTATELIDLQSLNRSHKNTHESDRAEWERLLEGVDDLSYRIRSLTGIPERHFPCDNLQRLEAVCIDKKTNFPQSSKAK